MADTDEALMLAVRDGDLRKLGVLFDRYHRVLFDFFNRSLGCRATADDLVQDVFFRILKYRRTFRDQSLFKAWMFHIARNVQFDHHKSHRGEVLSSSEERAADVPNRSPIPGQQLEAKQRAMLLECAMFKLAPEKREVLVLSRYQEMKYEEIAQVMGCEVGTVKVRVHRALKELRDIYLTLSNERPLCDVKKSANIARIM